MYQGVKQKLGVLVLGNNTYRVEGDQLMLRRVINNLLFNANCHDNAVAESFFQLLKRERIKEKIYGTREEARSDIFDYIEMFYNSKRRHGSSDQMSPTEYENQYYQRLGSV